MTIGPNPTARIRADMMLADLRRIGCPGPAIVDLVARGVTSPGRPIARLSGMDLEIFDAVDRGFAVWATASAWEPTALGVLASWAFRTGFFSGP